MVWILDYSLIKLFTAGMDSSFYLWSVSKNVLTVLTSLQIYNRSVQTLAWRQ